MEGVIALIMLLVGGAVAVTATIAAGRVWTDRRSHRRRERAAAMARKEDQQ